MKGNDSIKHTRRPYTRSECTVQLCHIQVHVLYVQVYGCKYVELVPLVHDSLDFYTCHIQVGTIYAIKSPLINNYQQVWVILCISLHNIVWSTEQLV